MATQIKRYPQSTNLAVFVQQIAITMMIIAFLLAGIVTGYLFYHAVKSVTKEIAARTNLPTTTNRVDLTLPIPLLTSSDSTLPILSLPIPIRGGDTKITGITGVELPDYEQKERVNILLMGVDKRPDETLARTDSLIVVTVDPNGQTANMLSIPRDLYVPIPGYEGEDRINKAYYLGEKDDYPGGGPALAMKTIQRNFGIPIHFYAQIDFQGFRDIVDTLGGITVEVAETIDDQTYPDENYGYDPFYIEAGTQTLNGYNALRYARTRHTPGSDFSRAQRQQQVLLAIRDQALAANMLTKIPELWATFSGSIDTNLQLIDIVELSQLAGKIDPVSINSAVIDYNYTVDYVTDTGAQVLLPLREKIQPLVDSFFAQVEQVEVVVDLDAQIEAHNQARANAIQQEVQQEEAHRLKLTQEKAALVVQNGTSRSNLASDTAQYLQQQGFSIAQFGPADSVQYETTVIVVYDESKLYTLQTLASIFEVHEDNVRLSPNPKETLSARVIVGQDFELPEQLSTFAITQ